MGNSSCTKLSICGMGLALGITKGLAFMLFAWVGYFFGYGVDMIHQVAVLYHGYGASVMGGVYGGLWGLLCGFIFGVIFAFIYNMCLCGCCCKKSY